MVNDPISQVAGAIPNWTELRLQTSQQDAELCAQMLLDCGCEGALIDDTAVLLDESEDATLSPKNVVTVTGYLPVAIDSEVAHDTLRQGLSAAGITAEIEVATLEPQDWSTAWQQNFPPLRIGKFLIMPPWENASDEGAIVIRLDPGLAFGTGQHPTTHMCLELLGEHLETRNGIQVLDVGCGSGILSIAAAKLGADVTASDLDTFCIQATRDNAQANAVELDVVQEAGLGWASEQYDLVVANLMSALLVSLAPQLHQATCAGGTLIVSGISAPRADDVEAALAATGFRMQHKREQNGDTRGEFIERWTAFVFEK